MKTVWIAGIAMLSAASAFAQSTTIYKHVDESGRITYSNKPMKGATVMELDPITTLPSPPAAGQQKASNVVDRADGVTLPVQKLSPGGEARPAVAIATPVPRTTLAAIEPQLQRKRDEERRRILEQELAAEEVSLGKARDALSVEQQNPTLIAAVRMAQQAVEPTAAQLVEMRNSVEKASSRIRGLQATVVEHEKNVEALKKELGALKP
jgi:hypothetical protein